MKLRRLGKETLDSYTHVLQLEKQMLIKIKENRSNLLIGPPILILSPYSTASSMSSGALGQILNSGGGFRRDGRESLDNSFDG